MKLPRFKRVVYPRPMRTAESSPYDYYWWGLSCDSDPYTMVPRFYRVWARDYCRNCIRSAPIGLHLVFMFIRWLYLKTFWYPRQLQKLEMNIIDLKKVHDEIDYFDLKYNIRRIIEGAERVRRK